MIDTGGSRLYTPELLALATELFRYPLTEDLQLRASGRSRTCGSTAEIGLRLDSNRALAAVGMRISACAMGQASSALLAKSAIGKSPDQVIAARDEIQGWLEGKGEIPQWPGFSVLQAAQELKGRHGAILLPWNAAVEALSKNPTNS